MKCIFYETLLNIALNMHLNDEKMGTLLEYIYITLGKYLHFLLFNFLFFV